MDVGARCNSGNGHSGLSRSDYDQFASLDISSAGSKAPIWRLVWRKIKREKRRLFYCSSSSQFTYDPYTYAQNFDQGSSWDGPDELFCRSFSARFAVPSRIFQNNELMV
ncbi:hypothetical protein RJ639_037799 [Escallonia herrerae]|uniref:Uncharacterized protein n=1 Tax=Escallonia herrerae TaxID=1293975 RepID=A0AA89B8E1_9ASTE|nr:hypothetical protein RJ639_037799 [Escallonia herrerae]